MRSQPCLRSASSIATLVLLFASAPTLPAQMDRSLLDTPQLPPDARLTLDLHAGDYQIASSTDGHIHISETRDEKNRTARATDVRFHRTSTGARLEIDPADHNSPHITINLPTCAALDLKLTAGELVFDTSPCTATTVSMHAGELRARMPDPNDFRTVRASVSIGEIDARGLGPAENDAESGGFFRTFKRTGNGSRTFAAHIGTGQITLDGRKQ